MQQTYADINGKRFTATVSGNTLTMFVLRGPEIVKMKIPPEARGRLTHAMRRNDFYAFTAAVDQIDEAAQ